MFANRRSIQTICWFTWATGESKTLNPMVVIFWIQMWTGRDLSNKRAQKEDGPHFFGEIISNSPNCPWTPIFQKSGKNLGARFKHRLPWNSRWLFLIRRSFINMKWALKCCGYPLLLHCYCFAQQRDRADPLFPQHPFFCHIFRRSGSRVFRNPKKKTGWWLGESLFLCGCRWRPL